MLISLLARVPEKKKTKIEIKRQVKLFKGVRSFVYTSDIQM